MKPELPLTIVPSLPVRVLADGKFVITAKFLEGLLQYCADWQGPITVLMRSAQAASGNLDDVAVRPAELPFRIAVVEPEMLATKVIASEPALVLASLDDFRQVRLSQICRRVGIPCVYVAEYSLRTRNQIIAATVANPLWRSRKYLWERGQENQRRRAVHLAAGLQCNGTPTYDAYRALNRDTLLYFDSRVTESMTLAETELRARCRSLAQQGPLRLLFSGRLNKMKGAHHLLPVASELKRLGVPFQLSICGDGDLAGAMRTRIAEARLSDCVTMRGVLDATTELFPYVKAEVDAFVCCHPQGDPSCTYLETMLCGVPIAGYANEALSGVVAHSRAGWLAPLGDPRALARKIAELNRDREAIAAMSLTALSWSQAHTFEKTTQARIAHLQRVAMENVTAERAVQYG